MDKEQLIQSFEKLTVLGDRGVHWVKRDKVKDLMLQSIEKVILDLVGESLSHCVCVYNKGYVKCAVCGVNIEKERILDQARDKGFIK